MAQMRGESTKHARFSTMQDANDQMGAGWKRARGEPTPAARLQLPKESVARVAVALFGAMTPPSLSTATPSLDVRYPLHRADERKRARDVSSRSLVCSPVAVP